MTDEENIQKLLTKIKGDEKGWRKTLATAEGSFSRNLAEENLVRLADLRHTLLNQLKTLELRRQHIMHFAIGDGTFTDEMGDGVCEQLAREGWLERAESSPVRPNASRVLTYVPTEKANQTWHAATSNLVGEE